MKITDSFVLFWRSAEVYSNWFPSNFEENGIRFANAEQYLMWSKAKLFGATEIANQMLMFPDPKALKTLGRQVPDYVEATWEATRLAVMIRGCYLKFSQNEGLKAELLSTGSRILVEASPYDKIWGIGLSETDPRALDQASWRGRNLLGIALMEVRRMLRAGEPLPA